MIRVPLLIVALFLGQYSIAQRPVTTAKRYAVVLASITRIIPKHHLSHMPNGDVISMRAFDMMFDQMDPRRLYFTDEDVQALLKYRDGLDDQAFKGKFDFAEELHERFLERVGKAEDHAAEALAVEHDFSVKENYELLPEQFCSNEDALKERWRKYIKYELLSYRADGLSDAEAASKLRQRYARIAKAERWRSEEKLLEAYTDTLCRAFGPHDGYFGPRTLDSFRR